MSGPIGKLYPTDYKDTDILDCITSFKTVTGQEPKVVYTRQDHLTAVSWLMEFGIQVLAGNIQSGTILLV